MARCKHCSYLSPGSFCPAHAKAIKEKVKELRAVLGALVNNSVVSGMSAAIARDAREHELTNPFGAAKIVLERK